MEAESKEVGPRARAKREQILAGAQRVFLQQGFAAASTDAIAAEAGGLQADPVRLLPQ